MIETIRRIPKHWLLLTAILFLSVPLLYRMYLVNTFVSFYIGPGYHGALQTLLNDSANYLALTVLLYASFSIQNNRPLTIVLRVLSLGFLGLYSMDVLVFKNYHSHLVVRDAIEYLPYFSEYVSQMYAGKQLVLFVGLTCAGIFCTLLLIANLTIRNRTYHYFFGCCIVFLGGMTLAPKDNGYVHSWIYQNFISYNLMITSEARSYSDGFQDAHQYESHQSCFSKNTSRQNVIVVAVESLSIHHSKYFSGINDWTPRLDAMAREAASFTEFYANGFTTEDGHIALLTARLPIYPPSSYELRGGTSFKGFFAIPDSVPSVLSRHGYQTEFLSSGDLTFANEYEWAKSIGFDYLEDADHPDYDTWPRFQFRAAPDEALYARVMDRVATHSNNPFFIFVATMSSHHPFRNPDGENESEDSEEAAIRYTDRQLGNFVDDLRESGYFQNGILVVVGDHRAMIPLSSAELRKFGPWRATARVPLVVVQNTGHPPIQVSTPYQQVDIGNSIRAMASGEICTSDWSGDVLSFGRAAPKYILHRRGDYRDRISVFVEDRHIMVKLDGDDTAVVDQHGAENPDEIEVIGRINSERLRSQTKTTE